MKGGFLITKKWEAGFILKIEYLKIRVFEYLRMRVFEYLTGSANNGLPRIKIAMN